MSRVGDHGHGDTWVPGALPSTNSCPVMTMSMLKIDLPTDTVYMIMSEPRDTDRVIPVGLHSV